MEKENEFDYKEDLNIDKHALDEELINQPAMFMKYSELLAKVSAERDRLKQKSEITYSELNMKIRDNQESFGFSKDKKLTEAAIESAITLHPAYQESQDALIEANYNVNILLSAKEAFSQRKSSLELLVKLFLSNYYSDSRIGQNTLNSIQSANDEEELRKSLMK